MGMNMINLRVGQTTAALFGENGNTVIYDVDAAGA